MNKKIDLTVLLKDCPSGMELDCLMYEDVYFDYVDERNIIHCYIQHETHKTSITFNQHGTHNNDIKSKCVIFPKGKTTWEGFIQPCKFKDGDIIADNYFKTICIFKGEGSIKGTVDFYCGIDNSGKYIFIKDIKDQAEHFGEINGYNFATEEEKQKLFKVLEKNGYKWNSETKTLEKLPKFKVGDRIKHKCENFRGERTIISCDKCGYWTSINDWIDYENQDDWILIPSKFDPKTLKPFESKVLVSNYGKWAPAIFGCYDKEHSNVVVVVGGNFYTKCIPYEGNEHLINTYDQPSEFYKYWEN